MLYNNNYNKIIYNVGFIGGLSIVTITVHYTCTCDIIIACLYIDVEDCPECHCNRSVRSRRGTDSIRQYSECVLGV